VLREQAITSETCVLVDGIPTRAVRAAADEHFAVAVTFGEVRLLGSGVVDHEQLSVTTRSATLPYTPPARW
jgi:hypothetical protein